jgi:hypothetical protein
VPAAQYTVRLAADPAYVQTLPAAGAGIAVSATPGASAALTFAAHDVAPPALFSAQFAFDAPAMAVRLVFTENIGASLTPADVQLVNRTTGQTIAPASLLLDYNPASHVASFTFTGYAHGALPDGDYRLTLPAGAVADASGNALADPFTFDFFTLAGDANHDRTVGFADLVAVAQHYDQPGPRTFSEGDFNYDGKVDFADLVTVAQRYDYTLPPPSVAAPARAPSALVSPGSAFAAARAPKPVRRPLSPLFSVTPVAKPAAKRPKPLARPAHR